MDRGWWHEYGGQIEGDFELWTSNPEAARIYELNFIRSEQGGGVSNMPGVIRQGGNSGFQAVGLALHFGAARVILLGYDMQLTGGKTHWHGDHKRLGNPMTDKMKRWHGRFSLMAAETSVPIVNATRQTALKCFRKVDLLESLAEPAACGS